MNRDRRTALTVAAALVGWSFTAGLAIPGRRGVQAGLAGALARRAGVRAQPGRGAAHGAVAAAVVALGVAASTALPAVREGMRQRELPRPTWRWLAVDIPVGTVWSEEAAYRGALATYAARGFGPRWGKVLQATAFGLSHIADARAAGEPVAGTVLITGLAGWVFATLAERTGSLLAPALVHLAVNEAGAIAALVVQRR
jgi:uncharacterized protein